MAGTSLHRPLCPEGRGVDAAMPAASPCPEASRPWVLAATILASAMAFIDGSVITIALPVMQGEFGVGLARLQWVVNGYTLFLAALILAGGAAGDRFGRRRLFLIGTVIFAAASAACAMAPGVWALIAARAVKGIGAALMVPQSLAIISAAFPPEIRGRAIGTWAAASAITTALGPAVGGFLIDGAGWRAAFWINLPLAAAVVVIARAHVPESRVARSAAVDWAGAALAIAASALVTIGLTRAAEPGGGMAAVAAGAIGIAAAVGFVIRERRAEAPLVPLALFREPAFAGANLVTFLLYGAFSGILFLLPFDLIGRRGLTAGEVGLVLLPLGLIIGLLSRPAGRLGDRIGARPLLVAGSVVVMAAAMWLAAGRGGIAGAAVGPVVALAGGMALVVAPLTTAVMNAAPDALAGAASGVNNAASRLAGLFAIALVSALAAAVFAATSGDPGPSFGAAGDPASARAFATAYGAGLAACAAMAALAAVTAWRMLAAAPTRDAS